MAQAPTLHQSFTAPPGLDVPFLEPESGHLGLHWYRFLLNLWRAVGSGNVSPQNAVVLQQSQPGSPVTLLTSTGSPVAGPISARVLPVSGQAEIVQNLGASPFMFVCPAGVRGFVISSAGTIQFSRSAGKTTYQVSTDGGAVPVLPGDRVTISWAAGAPTVIFMPD